jgi:hypothetical protein
MIMEPGVLYPLMAALYSLEDLEIIIRRFSAAYCHALGINIQSPKSSYIRTSRYGRLRDSKPTYLTVGNLAYVLPIPHPTSNSGGKKIRNINNSTSAGGRSCQLSVTGTVYTIQTFRHSIPRSLSMGRD